MDSGLVYHLLKPLVLTILIEMGVLWLLLGERRKKILGASVIVNCLTNVPLNLFLIFISYGWTEIAIGEITVLILETLWYYIFTKEWKRSAAYSFFCNAISFLSGLFIFYIQMLLSGN